MGGKCPGNAPETPYVRNRRRPGKGLLRGVLSRDAVADLLQRFYNGRVVNDRRLLSRLTTPGALRVPEITVYFWVIKALSTALGESTSDYLVHVINPVAAVGLGFVFFAGALILQFSARRYIAWTYWLAVVMVGVFGTMAADVLHVGFGVPYTASSLLYAVVLAAVFIIWGRTEKTLSIHSIDTPRREIFYWLAVVATFAMGTALGDFTATTLHLGYLASGFLFAAVIAIPAIGLPAAALGRRLLVLVRLRGDPSARRLVRRLPGQAEDRRRPRPGRRPGGPGARPGDLLPGRLPRRDPPRRAGRSRRRHSWPGGTPRRSTRPRR